LLYGAAVDEELLSAFREDAASALEVMIRLERKWPHIDADRAEAHLLEVFRIFHNLKGAADVLGIAAMHALAHAAEECLRNHFMERRKPDTAVIRDLAHAIETMIEHAEGDVTATGLDMIAMSLTDAASEAPAEEVSRSLEARLSTPAPALIPPAFHAPEPQPKRPTEDARLHEAVRSYRFIVARTAETLGKKVSLDAHVGDVAVPRTMLAALREPMMHLLRNAVDHGIEAPHERRARGKPEQGTITLHARRASGAVEITLSDDGRGLDRHGLREAALRAGRGVADFEDASLLELLFAPGLSTRSATGPVSGRGIGLDAARARLHALVGSLYAFEDASGQLGFRIVLPHETEASQRETDL
jgi:chemotaxis protein histidine kinase CheA